METGTSRLLLGATATLIVCAACGGAASTPHGSTGPRPGASPQTRPTFSWFKAQPPPQGWHVAQIPSGASMSYPASWRPQHGDTGTATVALRNAGGTFLGYLNITPRQGPETFRGWASFRVHHNHAEGDLNVRQLASASGLRFRSGHGNCVEDSYGTKTHAHYIEIACIVAGARATTVIVGAAPPSSWSQEAPVIERAIEGLAT